MRAKKVYEFVQKKGIKAEIGPDNLYRKSIEQSFEQYAPNTDFIVNNDMSIIVKDQLNLENSEATYLFDNMEIQGYLDLEGSNIKELPKNLKVESGLNLNNIISILPNDLNVGSFINISKTKIKKFPKGLKNSL